MKEGACVKTKIARFDNYPRAPQAVGQPAPGLEAISGQPRDEVRFGQMASGERPETTSLSLRGSPDFSGYMNHLEARFKGRAASPC